MSDRKTEQLTLGGIHIVIDLMLPPRTMHVSPDVYEVLKRAQDKKDSPADA